MLNPAGVKILRDIASNKSRTLLVVLAVAIGVFAMGTIVATAQLLDSALTEGYRAVNPASAIFSTEPFSPDLVAQLATAPGIVAMEGRYRMRVRTGEPGDGDWSNLELYAVSDFEDMCLNVISPVSGAWPPGQGQVLLEQSSLAAGAAVGDLLNIDVAGVAHQLVLVGIAHDLNVPPTPLAGRAYGYISFATLEEIIGSGAINELYIQVEDDPLDQNHIAKVAAEFRDNELATAGIRVQRLKIPAPGQHVLGDIFNTVMLVLALVGSLTLVLSSFLVVNTINSLLAQQVRQIGVMKAVGASTIQIAGIYLGMVFGFSLLALALGIPMAMLGARIFTGYLASILNLSLPAFKFPFTALAVQVAVGLLVPMVAALLPIIGSARISVRQAISDYGIRTDRSSGLDKFFGRLRGLPRPLLLSMRNTFKKRGRIILTLLMLTLSGTIFISVLSVRTSLQGALDDLANYWLYDVEVNFELVQEADFLREQAMAVEGVAAAETWLLSDAFYIRPDGSENENMFVIAPPLGSNLINPTMRSGRWLEPGANREIVVNSDFIHAEPDVALNSLITLKLGGRDTVWQVVGIISGQIMGPVAYVSYEELAAATGAEGLANRLAIRTEAQTASGQQSAARLDEYFRGRGLPVSEVDTRQDILSGLGYWFSVPVLLLLVMALLLAVVGGIGLMGAMALSVYERRREIGIMRALGAGSFSILQIFVTEGIVIGLLSWALGAAVALPVSVPLSQIVGMALVKAPLLPVYSWQGALLWLGVSVFLSIVVTLAPGLSATRVRVSEVLNYE